VISHQCAQPNTCTLNLHLESLQEGRLGRSSRYHRKELFLANLLTLVNVDCVEQCSNYILFWLLSNIWEWQGFFLRSVWDTLDLKFIFFLVHLCFLVCILIFRPEKVLYIDLFELLVVYIAFLAVVFYVVFGFRIAARVFGYFIGQSAS